MPINDTTPNLGLPLPHVDNLLADDVQRIRTAFGAVDGAFAAKADLVGGLVPASQLPGFVDDVLEYSSMAAFPATGETGKLYVAIDTRKVYRWGGSAYAEIASSPGSTDAVPEGSTNLYFTAARARAAQVPATPSTLGVVKVGSGLTVDADGILSAVGGGAQAVNKAGDTMTGALNWAPAVDVASAATTQIGLAASNLVRVTGTTTITNLGTIAAGVCRTATFAGALTLTHNAASLILPGGANITTAAGDVAEFESLGSGNWRCTSYMRAGGDAAMVLASPELHYMLNL